jgi:hypothetical protein
MLIGRIGRKSRIGRIEQDQTGSDRIWQNRAGEDRIKQNLTR